VFLACLLTNCLCHDFNFPIVKFPDTKSNIPNRIVFNVYISQLLRFLRVCSEIDDFKTETKMLISCFLLKGCNRQLLVKKTIQTLKSTQKPSTNSTFPQLNFQIKYFNSIQKYTHVRFFFFHLTLLFHGCRC